MFSFDHKLNIYCMYGIRKIDFLLESAIFRVIFNINCMTDQPNKNVGGFFFATVNQIKLVL